MKNLTDFLGVQNNAQWYKKFALSLVFPALILITLPLDMSFNQCLVVSSLVLTLSWWSANIIKKIPASIFLLASFLLFSGAKTTEILSFPLSETFLLIVFAYLLSRGISNSKIADKLLMPILQKYANTPTKVLLAIIFINLLTMYVIVQPLARLIIISVLIDTYLKGTDLNEDSRTVLMYACFSFYALINMGALNADIIMNAAAVGFSGADITDAFWIKCMAPPTAVYLIMMVFLFKQVFKKELKTVRIKSLVETQKSKLTKTEIQTLIIIILTLILWATSGIHGINSTLVTICATALMFINKVLRPTDIKAIDITTLVFLTAAFSIGTAMKSSGAADVVFSLLDIFPNEFSIVYILTMVLVTMLLHMILGSNTTTLSVVIPGLMILTSGTVSVEAIVFTAIVSVSFHAILPFHSVALMIGNSNGYFPAKYVTKFGLILTPILFLAVALIYVPWWNFVGII